MQKKIMHTNTLSPLNVMPSAGKGSLPKAPVLQMTIRLLELIVVSVVLPVVVGLTCKCINSN